MAHGSDTIERVKYGIKELSINSWKTKTIHKSGLSSKSLWKLFFKQAKVDNTTKLNEWNRQ